jgi:DNA-binding protein H-NS
MAVTNFGRIHIAIIGEIMSEMTNTGYRALLAQREALDKQIEALKN